MTNPIHPMNIHGYQMPISRSPTVDFMLEDEREYKYMSKVQAAHDNKDENIPSPYCYHLIISPPEDHTTIKDKFTKACNQRRWQHIINAEVKVKK